MVVGSFPITSHVVENHEWTSLPSSINLNLKGIILFQLWIQLTEMVALHLQSNTNIENPPSVVIELHRTG